MLICFKATRKCFNTWVGLRQCLLLFCTVSADSLEVRFYFCLYIFYTKVIVTSNSMLRATAMLWHTFGYPLYADAFKSALSQAAR